MQHNIRFIMDDVSWRFGPATKNNTGDFYVDNRYIEPAAYTPEHLRHMIQTHNPAYNGLYEEVEIDPCLVVDEGL